MEEGSMVFGPCTVHPLDYINTIQWLRISFFDFLPSKMGPISCPNIFVSNYHYSLPNKLLERSFHLPHDGSLKSSVAHIYGEATLRYEGLCIKNAKLFPRSPSCGAGSKILIDYSLFPLISNQSTR